MPLDIRAELSAIGSAAWSVQDNVVVGTHRPPHLSSGEQWNDVERHYCFGISETCEVEVEGRGKLIAGPDVIRFHTPGEQIRTNVFAETRCSSKWVLISEPLIEAVLEEYGSVNDSSARPFSSTFVHASLPVLATLKSFFRHVEGGACGVWVEETVTELLRRLMYPNGIEKEGWQQEATSRQRALAFEADELLANNYESELSLSEVAEALGVTASHLTRSYRAATGRRLHGRLTSLRLAAALDRLSDGASDLTTLGLDLGFANHSHFTATFRRLVGMPPSAFRSLCTNSSNIR